MEAVHLILPTGMTRWRRGLDVSGVADTAQAAVHSAA